MHGKGGRAVVAEDLDKGAFIQSVGQGEVRAIHNAAVGDGRFQQHVHVVGLHADIDDPGVSLAVGSDEGSVSSGHCAFESQGGVSAKIGRRNGGAMRLEVTGGGAGDHVARGEAPHRQVLIGQLADANRNIDPGCQQIDVTVGEAQVDPHSGVRLEVPCDGRADVARAERDGRGHPQGALKGLVAVGDLAPGIIKLGCG